MSLLAQMEVLRHMLGISPSAPVKQWGWRNYFNSPDAGPDLEALQALQTQGLVEQYRRNYWRATELGMRVAGLPYKTQLKLLAKPEEA